MLQSLCKMKRIQTNEAFMKTTMLFLLITFSINTFADCVDDYTNGFNEYNFATRYFDKGMSSYNKAVELSQSDNPVFVEICNLLVDSVTGFSVSKDSYLNCVDAFNSAITSCSGDDSTQASKNREVCASNQSIARDNHVVIGNLLKNTCFKGSKKLEFLELGEVEYLIY